MIIESPPMKRHGTAHENKRSAGLSSAILRPKALMAGTAAGVVVTGFYLGLLTLTSDWYNARMQFADYRWWIISLSVGLGIQAFLFTALRSYLNGTGIKTAKSGIAASGGVSTVAMAACCSHYLATFLPLVGLPFLSAAAAGLEQYQVQFFMAGVISNLFGIAVMLRQMKRAGLFNGN